MAKYSADDVPNVDLVVIWIGQNDLILGHIKPDDETTGTEKYTELLAKVRELRPDTPVLCLYPGNVMNASHPFSRGMIEMMGKGGPGFGPDSTYALQKVH